MTIVLSVLALAVLIFVHELGHFLLAKYNNIAVLAFSIGFGPKLWKRRIGETTYSIGIIPLGGYVRMAGDDPLEVEALQSGKSQPTDKQTVSGVLEAIDPIDEAILRDKSRWFLNKGFWPKFWVVFAGPLFNIIFAVLAAFVVVTVYGAGEPIDKPIIGAMIPNFPAEKAGLKLKDFVKSIDGQEMTNWEQLAKYVRQSGGKEMLFKVERTDSDGVVSELDIKVVASSEGSFLASEDDIKKGDVYRIGIEPGMIKKKVSLGTAAKISVLSTWFVTKDTWRGLSGLVTGKVSAKNLAGPIFIFSEAGKSAERGLDSLLGFMIVLSVSLAILNLLPIPVLDGGHLLFFMIEAIKGSPLSLKFREVSNQLGALIILALVVFSLGNDILRHWR